MRKFWNTAAPEKNGKILVPLCGKSLDMLWLAGEGYRVLGVEISEIACRDFFVENQLPYVRKDGAPFTRYSSGTIEIWRGDFFDLTPDDMDGTLVAYDRAALIALPETMRTNYATHLATLLQPSGARIFLISMDYDENKMKGPPFSVPETEVRDLFEKEFSVDLISQSSGPDIVGNLATRGLDTLNEKVYRIRRLSGCPV